MRQEKMVEHYRIIDNPDTRQMNSVQLVKTPYEGIEYAYGNLKFDRVDGEPIVRFVYEVHKNPNNLKLDNDRTFLRLISDILDEILMNAFAD